MLISFNLHCLYNFGQINYLEKFCHPHLTAEAHLDDKNLLQSCSKGLRAASLKLQ